VEAPAPEWGPAVEPDEDTEPEALTIVEVLVEHGDEADALDPWEHGPGANGAEPEPEPEPEPELAERGGLFRRRRR
jgi:hypothetical protein